MGTEVISCRARTTAMRWIQRLIEKFGNLRRAGIAIDEDYQRLQRMMDPAQADKQKKLMNRLRKARIALGMSHKAFYEEIEEEVEQEFKK